MYKHCSYAHYLVPSIIACSIANILVYTVLAVYPRIAAARLVRFLFQLNISSSRGYREIINNACIFMVAEGEAYESARVGRAAASRQ